MNLTCRTFRFVLKQHVRRHFQHSTCIQMVLRNYHCTGEVIQLIRALVAETRGLEFRSPGPAIAWQKPGLGRSLGFTGQQQNSDSVIHPVSEEQDRQQELGIPCTFSGFQTEDAYSHTHTHTKELLLTWIYKIMILM